MGCYGVNHEKRDVLRRTNKIVAKVGEGIASTSDLLALLEYQIENETAKTMQDELHTRQDQAEERQV